MLKYYLIFLLRGEYRINQTSYTLPDVIRVILILFPGLIALFVNESIIGSRRINKSETERLFVAVAYTIPSFFLTLFLLKLINYIPEFHISYSLLFRINVELKNDVLWFIGIYFVVAGIAGTILAIVVATQASDKSMMSRFISFVRKNLGKPAVLGGVSPWDKLFCNRDKQVVEIITSNGISVKGFKKDFTFAGNDVREMTVEGIGLVEKWDNHLKTVKYIYYDFNSETIIKVYDMQPLLNNLERVEQRQEG